MNVTISSNEVKKKALGLGAKVCGIAPVQRFKEAPKGFHPADIFPETKSVVALAKLLPEGTLQANSPVPYSSAYDVLLDDVIRITFELCLQLERNDGLIAVPIPSEPYEYWDDEQKVGKGILSLKHAGYLAGLGSIGRNSLLANAEYGNRLLLGAALLNVTLEGDPITDYQFCDDNCNLCMKSCPVSAIHDSTVNQKLCRSNSGYLTKKGYFLYVCNECRKVCPNGPGTRLSEES
jgi:epoxyqueuosine reductase QueG